jgi:dihydroflavonol-4-reductase
MSFQNQTFFVTGGTGFVGAAVIRCLSARGAQVRALVRPGSNRRNLYRLDATLIEGDLHDTEALTRAMKDCAGVFHVAADYRLWVPDPAAMMAANVQGTKNIMEAAQAAGVGRIVYTSSVAVLGAKEDGTDSNEETPSTLSDMIGAYKQSKFLAEEAVRKMVAECGLPAVIVNPSTPIGPGDVRPTPTGRIIVEAIEGKMPAYVDTGLNIAHVDDVALGHILAYEKGQIGERYILGGENMYLGDMLRLIAKLSGTRPPWGQIPRRLIYPLALAAEAVACVTGREPFVTINGLRMAKKKMFFSSDRARRELGYNPRSAEVALEDAILWFRSNGYLS